MCSITTFKFQSCKQVPGPFDKAPANGNHASAGIPILQAGSLPLRLRKLDPAEIFKRAFQSCKQVPGPFSCNRPMIGS